MNKMMLFEQRQSTEDARLVNGQDFHLQFAQRQRPGRQCQLTHHHYSVGRGLDAMLLEQLHTFFLFHHYMSDFKKLPAKLPTVFFAVVVSPYDTKDYSSSTFS